MRCTITLAVFAAVAAAQSSILPISQISDGQIQAPPATSVPEYGTSGVAAPSSEGVYPSASGVPSVVPTSVIVAPTTAVVVPVPSVSSNGTLPVSSGTFSNSTGYATSRAAGPTSAGSTPTPTASSTALPGSDATMNMVSFGGMALAVAAFVFA